VKLLLVDNYDSFTWNLAQALMSLGADVRVERNDQLSVAEAKAWAPDRLVISPGPGTPDDAGVSLDMLSAFMNDIPILGVCLGHQSIGQVLGGRVVRAQRLMHGKSSPVLHDGKGVYKGLSNPFEAARYHSLVVENLPSTLVVSAYTAEGEVMGIRHTSLPVEGVQFHPESILTPEGDHLLKNFLEQA